MAFTAKDVQALREKTGCGMMDCKKALVECDGNMDASRIVAMSFCEPRRWAVTLSS